MPTCVADRIDERPGGREDLEFRALIQAAEAGLDGARTPVLRRPPHARPAGSFRSFAAIVVIIAVPAIALPIRLSIASADPVVAEGILDAGAFVESKARPPTGRFLVAAIKETPGARPNTTAAMKESQRNAVAAALACTGSRDAGNIRLRAERIKGPSAGFMFALTVVDRLLRADLTTGKQIAGTGKVTADGRVEPVGMIAQKANAAERAGADLFFVPFKQLREAKRAAPTLEVVGVRHLTDAVRRLSGSGCR